MLFPVKLIQCPKMSQRRFPGRIKKYISPYRSPCVLGKGCPLPVCGFSIDNFLDILLPGSMQDYAMPFPCVTTLRLCFTFRSSSMLCPCQRFLASPLLIRPLSCLCRTRLCNALAAPFTSRPCHALAIFTSHCFPLPLQCFLSMPPQYRAFQCNAITLRSLAFLCPLHCRSNPYHWYSVRCIAPAILYFVPPSQFKPVRN